MPARAMTTTIPSVRPTNECGVNETPSGVSVAVSASSTSTAPSPCSSGTVATVRQRWPPTGEPRPDLATRCVPSGRRIHLTIGPASWVFAFTAVIAAFVVSDLAGRARQPLGWALAAVVAAGALDVPVDAVARRVKRRGIALVLVLVPVLAVIGGIAWAVVGDLDDEVRQLQRDIPAVAAEIEESERFGEAAREFGLVAEAEKFAEGLRRPSEQVGEEARGGASTWFLTLILTIFALLWGRRLADSALAQIADERRRSRVATTLRGAFDRSQRYVVVSVVLGLTTGVAAWACFRLADLPAPTPLALLVGVGSLVPIVGVVLTMWSAAALAGGVVSPATGLVLAATALVLQVVHSLVMRRATRGLPRPGPAIIVLSFIVGWSLYGVGGVLVGTALIVYAVAVIDVIRETESLTL